VPAGCLPCQTHLCAHTHAQSAYKVGTTHEALQVNMLRRRSKTACKAVTPLSSNLTEHHPIQCELSSLPGASRTAFRSPRSLAHHSIPVSLMCHRLCMPACAGLIVSPASVSLSKLMARRVPTCSTSDGPKLAAKQRLLLGRAASCRFCAAGGSLIQPPGALSRRSRCVDGSQKAFADPHRKVLAAAAVADLQAEALRAQQEVEVAL